jgi:hypothetical protein
MAKREKTMRPSADRNWSAVAIVTFLGFAPIAATPAVAADSLATVSAFLPAVHVVGASGVFRTDVEVFNPDVADSADVVLYLTPPDADYTQLPGIRLDPPLRPRESVTFPDIVSQFFGYDNAFGNLNVVSRKVGDAGSDGPPLVVTSNTYNVAGALSGTYGQFSPGQPLRKAVAFDDSVAGELYVIGLRNDANTRTNVGILNTEAVPLEAGMQLVDAIGRVLAQRVYSVAPYSIRQINDLFGREFLAAGIPAGGPYRLTLFVNRSNGARLLCYASVSDLRTGDPYLIPGEPVLSGSASPTAARTVR